MQARNTAVHISLYWLFWFPGKLVNLAMALSVFENRIGIQMLLNSMLNLLET